MCMSFSIISQHLSVPLLEVPATALVSGVSGESEKNIRQLFEQALVSTADLSCKLFSFSTVNFLNSNFLCLFKKDTGVLSADFFRQYK